MKKLVEKCIEEKTKNLCYTQLSSGKTFSLYSSKFKDNEYLFIEIDVS